LRLRWTGWDSYVFELRDDAWTDGPQPARVTAHMTPKPNLPNQTTILIKLEKSVLEREEAFKK
jgi:hypothetical protein